MARGALAVRTQPPGGPTLTVVVCHLKSERCPIRPLRANPFAPRDEGERARYTAYALYRRAAEAVTVRALTDQFLHGDRSALPGRVGVRVGGATLTRCLRHPPDRRVVNNHCRVGRRRRLVPCLGHVTDLQ